MKRKGKQRAKNDLVLEHYTPPVRVLIGDPRYIPQPGDKIEIYGPGQLVLERDGHVVAIAREVIWERPQMMCSLSDAPRQTVESDEPLNEN